MSKSFSALVPDIFLPVGIYFVLHRAGFSDVIALSAGGFVPGLRVILGIARRRRINGFALFVLSIFVLSIGLAFVSGDARFVLAQESAFTLLAGLYCLGSLLARRPLTYYTGRRLVAGDDPVAVARWERLWEQSKDFRSTMRIMTIVWGLGFVFEALLRLVLVYTAREHDGHRLAASGRCSVRGALGF